MRGTRRAFWTALVCTVVILLVPGDSVAHAKERIASWLPFAVAIEAADATANFDKLVHASLFAVLGWLAARSWVDAGSRSWAVAGLLLLGVATELLQTLVPGRSASIGDWLADAIGLACGFWMALKVPDQRSDDVRVAA